VTGGGCRPSRRLEEALEPRRDTAKAAVVDLDAIDESWDVGEAVRATTAEGDIQETEEDEGIVRRALNLLGSRRNDAHEAALAELREAHKNGGQSFWRVSQMNCMRARSPPPQTPVACAPLRKEKCCPGGGPQEGTRQPPIDPRAGVR
jgi:hypothetical protein